ncbi:Uncharacterised protein [Mycobacteroides abscessus subsp. abscessus]|nr:Uncharacterised protein [Mycobacteroides abscessus subsp. abscessus]
MRTIGNVGQVCGRSASRSHPVCIASTVRGRMPVFSRTWRPPAINPRLPKVDSTTAGIVEL